MGSEGLNAEEIRLAENAAHKVFWKKWGPYLSFRQWGTVREDYSADGEAWKYFPHEHARSRVYRWGEDGIGGISDINQDLCFAPAFWNGKDRILKERLFGLSSHESNHGEDVKELYYFLDNTPTHSYMKFLYKYPHSAYPYEELTGVSARRTRLEPEYELLDTGIFGHNGYFDIFLEYAKAGPEDLVIKIEVFNRGEEEAEITLLPTLWFRNTWSYGRVKIRPEIRQAEGGAGWGLLEARHESLGTCSLFFEDGGSVLFTENETNTERLFGAPNVQPFVKDAFHEAVIKNNLVMLREKTTGTKAAILYRLSVPGGQSRTIRLRLCGNGAAREPFGKGFEEVIRKRLAEADEFYARYLPEAPVGDVVQVQRQAFAGLLWSKQYYNYEIEAWLKGDPGFPPPPPERLEGRNSDWTFLFNRDVISMPDKWEYPWYASWDLAFHCIPLAVVDPDYAKKQLILFLREWYMKPNGQIPAYEWNLGDVNPPVHAWASLKVYEIDRDRTGTGDIDFLKKVFHKLLLNFTWWVNRVDVHGNNIFQGGFLGLDNIGVFDRSKPLPTGGHLGQVDGTSWMAMYSLNLMEMAMEIAVQDRAYEDVASKFFEHFVHISEALNLFDGHHNISLWDSEDSFFYDALHCPDCGIISLKVKSVVGLIPLFAVSVVRKEFLERLKGFRKRMMWFVNNRRDLNLFLAIEEPDEGETVLFSQIHRDRLVAVLRRILDETEFLSPGGIRSISREHKERPFVFGYEGTEFRVDYEPDEAVSDIFGGNSNWRGPVWMPMNYLLIESLKKYHRFYGDSLKVECPTGSGNMMNLWEVAKELARRVTSVFIRDESGRRPVHGGEAKYLEDPAFRDLVLFYEYLHGETGKGLGASHQTGWTALVAEMIRWCWCE